MIISLFWAGLGDFVWGDCWPLVVKTWYIDSMEIDILPETEVDDMGEPVQFRAGTF